MNITVKHGKILQQKTPCLVLGAYEGKLRSPLFKELDTLLEGALQRSQRDKEFSAKHREHLLLHPGKNLPADRVLLVGLGKEKGAGPERIRQAVGSVVAYLQGKRIAACTIDLDSLPFRGSTPATLAQAVTESLALASYRFDHYRTENRDDLPSPLEEIRLLVGKKSQAEQAGQGVAEALHISRGVILARDLVNEPGNTKSPDFLARRARAIAEETGMSCTILERASLEQQGFGALLGVAQGSIREPRLIVLEYRGDNGDSHPIALVGKGVVFDSGGISLKPAEKMDEMKMDMAGGAAVLGTMLSAALLKLPVHLVGVVPAVENLPSGSAIRPGDILTSLSGKTIEVLNTDAEGRLILADALTYVKRFNPRVVIDLATLTGACIIALGHHATGVMGNHEGLIRQLLKSGEHCGERLWQLPLWEEYAQQIKSDIADVKNTGGRPAGTITAAAFLQKFAEEYTWAHLDIAGTAWEEKGRPYIPKGATGVGVRLLVEYLRKR
ncbi:putative cytosol aminopeptidase [Desulfuromonas versatilis]|uniref:Probable cytosol aminopeptidase n=1 Tax=Desulfuromonas versatilis TaxID=2802975 RepID=A0ABM8HMB4_9BACT|nr:leucyl aminopeptidase [Desulfuromonas versatilis]BCR03395.1 putative cytosol aminopeptidase [Desulfuromonas versatilis]